METIVASTTNFIKSGVLIGSTFNLGHGLGRVLAKRNLNRSSRVLVATTGVVGTPQMVFTNPLMITHVNKIANRPLMKSMAIGRYTNMYKCWKSRRRISKTICHNYKSHQ
jgi:hypothetical protein